jgi:hypothetical protein
LTTKRGTGRKGGAYFSDRIEFLLENSKRQLNEGPGLSSKSVWQLLWGSQVQHEQGHGLLAVGGILLVHALLSVVQPLCNTTRVETILVEIGGERESFDYTNAVNLTEIRKCKKLR